MLAAFAAVFPASHRRASKDKRAATKFLLIHVGSGGSKKIGVDETIHPKKLTETRFERITFWRLPCRTLYSNMLESDALPLRHSAKSLPLASGCGPMSLRNLPCVVRIVVVLPEELFGVRRLLVRSTQCTAALDPSGTLLLLAQNAVFAQPRESEI